MENRPLGIGSLLDFPVTVTEHAMARAWVFPVDRFVEYEPEDEWWARKYGLGYEGSAAPACFRVGRLIVIHPVLWRELQETVGGNPDGNNLG